MGATPTPSGSGGRFFRSTLSVKYPAPPAESYQLADGVVALGAGLAWLPTSRCILAADAHLAYEDVVGGALPLWSTAEIIATLALTAERMNALEIVFLGDIVHGARMSEGATRTVGSGLDVLRKRWVVTLVAGNHEGRTRAFRILGTTVEACERDGWLLVHGDRPAALARRAIIGHLHPSLHMGGNASAPAFAASPALVVVPALTPYSPGLDLLSADFANAIGRWGVTRADVHVVVAASDRVYPFGSLASLREILRAKTAPRPPAGVRRRRLSSDR
jgi:metallophosphoesterase superfamily enzyme